MNMPARPSLSGVKVTEGPARLAVTVCTSLLADLGADISKVVPMDRGDMLDRDDWRQSIEEADVVIASPAALPPQTAEGPILCGVSTTGAIDCPGVPGDASEIVLQAAGGLMATSGHAGGAPEAVHLPVLEVFAGIDAATSVLAALRVVEAGGPAQLIDAAVWDSNASLLGTFVAQVTSGKGGGYRDGARHAICAPWNAYPARDGHVMICTSNDAQWKRLLELMAKADAVRDTRFADITARRKNIDAVDALVSEWTSKANVADLVASLKRSGIPAGAIASGKDQQPSKAAAPFKLSRTPLRREHGLRTSAPAASSSRRPQHITEPTGVSCMPLSGIRVVEVGPFTAGPLAGRSLSDLGADVVKVEPPSGEVSRSWSPRAGHVSGYFANYNVGKRSVALDLARDHGRETFERLLAGADVLVENLKAGALDRLGFGAEAVAQRHPRMIYCSISGYGHDGPRDAALDTVIQAESGIMGRVGKASAPAKVGFSVADLIAGHLAPLAILAALRACDRDGLGQHVDISMLDALRWLIEMGSETAHKPFDVARADAHAWAVVASPGDAPTKVRDLGEVFADPSLVRRSMLLQVATRADHPAHVMGSPYSLTLTPPRPGKMIGDVGVDLDRVLADWSLPRADRGATA